VDRLAVRGVTEYQATVAALVFRVIFENLPVRYCYDQVEVPYSTLPCPYPGVAAENPFTSKYLIPDALDIQCLILILLYK
jgi:hypothetical protein